MCSTGVFFGVWLCSFMKLISSCSGVFESRRTRSVSVVIFSGMRLSTTIFRGRMSCEWARVASITKMFSCLSRSIAGSLSGSLNGTLYYIYLIGVNYAGRYVVVASGVDGGLAQL